MQSSDHTELCSRNMQGSSAVSCSHDMFGSTATHLKQKRPCANGRQYIHFHLQHKWLIVREEACRIDERQNGIVCGYDLSSPLDNIDCHPFQCCWYRCQFDSSLPETLNVHQRYSGCLFNRGNYRTKGHHKFSAPDPHFTIVLPMLVIVLSLEPAIHPKGEASH